MGWALKRADGTYRYWSRHEKIPDIAADETWEERDTPPEVTQSLAEQDTDVLRDAYKDAKAAVTTFAANSTLATAKPAIIKLAQCVEELLKFLNHRIE